MQPDSGHAVLVDGFQGAWVLLRDPWPPGAGAAYKVDSADFMLVWLLYQMGKTLTGRAVVIE